MRLEGDYSVTSASKTEGELRGLVHRYRPDFRGQSLQIQFHQNTCTMVSLSRRGPDRTLRIHWLFTKAPPAVLDAVVRSFFAKEGAARSRHFRTVVLDFIEENRSLTLSVLCARQLRSPRGRAYDLEEVEERVRARHLNDCPEVRIGWSPRVTPCLMGKWIQMPHGSPNVVVINRLLDDGRVPRFYLDYIVFHELLHELIPIRRERGRWVHHPAEFRRIERQFPGYERAQRWEKENIAKLFSIHARDSGRTCD
jgi:hypothetical protein